MLQRRPEDRYADMRQVEHELRALAGEASSASPRPVPTLGPEAPTLDPHAPAHSRPSARASWAASRPPDPAQARTSIAVLPFTSLSADPDDAFTAEGIASEIIVALGGVPDLRVASELASFRFRGKDQDLSVIAKSLGTRYVLAGSLRRAGDRIRVLAALTDAEAGAQIWSKAYDRRLADLFAVQEEIAQAIVGATGGEIIRADAARMSRSSAEQLDAWGLLHRAYHFWNHAFTFGGLDEALAQARRAVELDPAYAAAHAFLGLYLIERVIHVLTPRVEEERQEALRAAERAIELAPRDARALESAGLVFYHCSLHERSVGVLRRAVEIAPFNLVAWGYLGLGLGIAGDGDEVEEGRRILDRLLETTPDHPSLPYWLYFKGGVLTRQGRLEEAAGCAGRTVELQPHFFLAAVMLANALGSLGRPEEARAAWERVQAVHPGFTPEGYAHEIQLQALTPEKAEPHLAGLRTAGILRS
jgi:TolB-like protein/Tfp pilus assembly protein PilF